MDTALEPGQWARIERSWKTGDHVELSLDMPLRLVPLDRQHKGLVPLMRGPVALFAVAPQGQKVSGRSLLAAKRRSESANDSRVDTESGPLVMKPFAEITTERYRLYQTVEA